MVTTFIILSLGMVFSVISPFFLLPHSHSSNIHNCFFKVELASNVFYFQETVHENEVFDDVTAPLSLVLSYMLVQKDFLNRFSTCVPTNFFNMWIQEFPTDFFVVTTDFFS